MNDWKKALYACVITLLVEGLFLGSIIVSLQLEKQQQLAEKDKQIVELKANANDGQPIFAGKLPVGHYRPTNRTTIDKFFCSFVQRVKGDREFPEVGVWYSKPLTKPFSVEASSSEQSADNIIREDTEETTREVPYY